MAKPRLHHDADASMKALESALNDRGHDVTRTPNEWMPMDASDERQLLGAIAHERCIFTFNVRDFAVLPREYPHHAGIILAAQRSWSLSDLIAGLDRALTDMSADRLAGQVHWLNRWRGKPIP